MRPTVSRTGAALIGGLIVAAALAGCAVGPDYVAPTVQMAPFHNVDAVAARRTDLPAPTLDTWWKGFDDPMLEKVVQRALAQNLDLQAAIARVSQARAAAQAAGAQLLPTVDAGASYTAEHQSTQSPLGALASAFPNYSRDQKEYVVGATASWEIDLAGGLRRSRAAARDEAQAAEAAQLGTRITVAADAADAYLQVRGLQARLAVAQDQVDTDARLLSLVQARKQAGAADEREVAQAEALLRQARASLPTLRITLEAQLNRLDVLMGAQPGSYAAELGANAASIPSVPAIGTDDQPIDVLRRRPDMIAAERHLAATSEQIGAAIADYYPKISLSGALGFDSITSSHLFSARSFQPVGTGALQWRLFDFGKVDAEVKQARGANAEALAQYRAAALKATQDVEDAFVTLAQTELRNRELQQEVTALMRARDLSEKAYRAGSITLTDVLDADRQLLVARDDLDATRADAARAAVRTFRALGGGWDAPHQSQEAGHSPQPAQAG
ncbi:efflux transporter outer membrane subunit [Burkholderia cenocepacia]|uniref:efflux transporter outer membrane subunit n=1 Tax=Burkholderia cenocepacia TaxID=95486 RepID=UPI0009FEF6C3|nr:efflux transporter outer membrane subunit [Burkholderia cenocepacia]MCW3674608.1 efflux transporter outer membrane subunit [Burkholderia cenocepacia]MDC6082482.1 efflux transporter outer membrane subunit [Burkholderia cenocepacia]SPV02557.1 NodT family RND efflux system outer membrane lipoprotein [Burkholderia cenocepacia]